MQALPLLGGPVQFAGAVSLEMIGGSVRPWRIPHGKRSLFEPGLQLRAADPAGVRLTMVSDTSCVEVDISPMDPDAGLAAWQVDLLVDGQFFGRVTQAPTDPTARFEDLPEGEHRLEVYLPQRRMIKVDGLRVDAGAAVRPFVDQRLRWTVYGSSITHCGEAAGPAETWPALVARRFDLNYTCLGYGGNCHMEPMVARMIRDLPADMISMKLGINVQGGATLTPRTFRAAVIGTIATVRDGHPRTPITVVSPIISPPRENEPNRAGMTLPLMREAIAEAVRELTAHGDSHLSYVDGLEIFGPSCVGYLPDKLHPNAEGQHVLAENYAARVMPTLGLREAALATG